MVGYYILSAILLVFFIGSSCLFYDMIRPEPEEFTYYKPTPPVENFAKFIVDNYNDDYDDNDKNLGF